MPCYVFLGDDFRLPDLDSLTQSRNGVFGLASGDVNDGFFWDLWWIDMDSDLWWILGDGWRFFYGFWVRKVRRFLGALLVLRRTHLILLGPGVPTPSWYQQKRIATSWSITHIDPDPGAPGVDWLCTASVVEAQDSQLGFVQGKTQDLTSLRIADRSIQLVFTDQFSQWDMDKKKPSTWTSRNLKEILHEYAIFCWT